MLKIRRKHGTNRNSWEAITRQLAGVEHSRSDRTLSVPESGILGKHTWIKANVFERGSDKTFWGPEDIYGADRSTGVSLMTYEPEETRILQSYTLKTLLPKVSLP